MALNFNLFDLLQSIMITEYFESLPTTPEHKDKNTLTLTYKLR